MVDFCTEINSNCLSTIRNWSLVPVMQKSCCFLAPINDLNKILIPEMSKPNLFFNILKQLNFPVLNVSVIPDYLYCIVKAFKSDAVSLTNNEDILRFLDTKKHYFNKKILTNDKYRWQIFQELAGCVYKEYLGRKKKGYELKFRLSNVKAMNDDEICRILKNLDIYEDVYERVGSLNNASNDLLYCINVDQTPQDIREKIFDKGENSYLYKDFIDFANHKNLFIMNSSSFPVISLEFYTFYTSY